MQAFRSSYTGEPHTLKHETPFVNMQISRKRLTINPTTESTAWFIKYEWHSNYPLKFTSQSFCLFLQFQNSTYTADVYVGELNANSKSYSVTRTAYEIACYLMYASKVGVGKQKTLMRSSNVWHGWGKHFQASQKTSTLSYASIT